MHKPMTRALIVALGAALLLPGCILIPVGRRPAAVIVERCRPNEYWDGHECRHKGKGHHGDDDDHGHEHGHGDHDD